MNSTYKVALVHDWLTGMRGGEKVLELFCELFPSADLFTLVYIPEKISSLIKSHKIFTSHLQKIPFIEKYYRYALPLMPHAIASFDLSGYDLVISSSHCVAKGCRVKEGSIHICYCHSPMRYIWDQYENYFDKRRSSFYVRWFMKLFRKYLQDWDIKSAQKVKYFIANSHCVQDRIKNYYGRESTVIYPPVNVDFYSIEKSVQIRKDQKKIGEEFYLIVSAFAPYKRIDVAIEAFNQLGKQLRIIGSGPEEIRLKSMAKENIRFLGWRSSEDIRDHYQNCRALIFPGVEDFGIVPVETMACGRPVIAFGKGGVLETVVEKSSGLFFKEQTVESLIETIKNFEKMNWDPIKIRQSVIQFSREEFKKNICNFLEKIFP